MGELVLWPRWSLPRWLPLLVAALFVLGAVVAARPANDSNRCVFHVDPGRE